MFLLEFPKVFDNHSHFSLSLLWQSCLDLSLCRNFAEVLEKLVDLQKDQLNLAVGYHNEIFDLDEDYLEKSPPLVIINYSLHGFIANRSAKKLLPIDDLPPEKAMLKVWQYWANLKESEDPQLWKERIYELAQVWNAKGLYGACDMLSFILPFRFENFVLDCYYPDLDKEMVKIFLDGSLGARTAAFTKEYLLYKDWELERLLLESTDKDVAVHALGPLASEQILNVLERLPKRPKIRLEHCQFIDKTQALRAKELGIILSMQPNFNQDSLIYKDWLGSLWSVRNNPFRMLIDEVGFRPGHDLLFGSDNLPLGLAPTLESALFSEIEGQRLCLEELLKGYRADDRYGTNTYQIDCTKKTASFLQRSTVKN